MSGSSLEQRRGAGRRNNRRRPGPSAAVYGRPHGREAGGHEPLWAYSHRALPARLRLVVILWTVPVRLDVWKEVVAADGDDE